MSIDTKAFRERARSPQYVRGDTGGEYISACWAEMIADDLIGASDEVDRLRAAITQALTTIEADTASLDCDPLCAMLREALGIEVGP